MAVKRSMVPAGAIFDRDDFVLRLIDQSGPGPRLRSNGCGGGDATGDQERGGKEIGNGRSSTPASVQISLSWSAVSGATSYTVKQSAFPSGPFNSGATKTTNSQVIAGLTNGSTYYFVVSASNGVGEGADSTNVSATPSGLPAPFVTADIGSVGLAGSCLCE